MEDTDIIEIFNMVKQNPSKSSFTIKDVVLFKLLPRGKTKLRVPYIPQTLIKDILFTHHDHPLAGHFGVERTWRNIKNKYYWPNMNDSIENYIRSCSKCSKFNIQRRKAPGLLQPIDLPSEVFQVLGLDWWGPAPVSSDEYKYVLVITDRLSGYVIAKASSNNTAQTTAQILMENVILVHGAPDKIITDQGQHFNNELIAAMSALIGSKHVFSTPYHPQTNGQTERFNATFATQLSKYCDEDKSNWDLYLPSILAFARIPRNPFDRPQTEFKFSRPNDYWTELQRFKAIANKMTRSNIQYQQTLTKQRYDRNRSSPVYNIDDLVWLKILIGRSKLDERYRGPYRITDKITAVNYMLDDGDGAFMAHVNNLLPVYERLV
ncbi:unnamed protein product [Didymodactylos carnosus]|uniref:Integrase catalytic domain-containing protein n=1 Tax=Didymodactylos carnosus TaxID=1234261 RepID=A0A8S2E9P5_9BILA|nr:unnamed protein product [Didymodactylos carnosus]CAF3980561.1 unnamed protein product [Didymodactylos carnosus]